MSDALLAHAFNNAWANPQVDRQHVIGLTRLSADIGDVNHTTVMYERVPLPSTGEYYHVFIIGQNHPWTWNFADNYVTPLPLEQWVRLSDLSKQNQLTANLYMDNGVQLPNPGVFVRMRYDHNIIVAHRTFTNMDIPRRVNLYLRVYSNAYFESMEIIDRVGKIQNFGGQMANANEVLAWQNKYLDLKKKPGLAQAFVNGVLVDDFPPGSYRQRDWLDVRYDATVTKVIDIPVADMPVFLSKLDKTQKVVCHPKREQTDADLEMVCFDDVDFYVIGSDKKGLLYHRNVRDAVRTLTHRDYALKVSNLQNYIINNPGWGDINQLNIRLVIRNTGKTVLVPFEHHRLRELYKFTDKLILEAMVGVRSTLPEWTAAELELSKYSELLMTPYPLVNLQLVRDAYAYNAMSKVLSETPLTAIPSDIPSKAPVVDLPPGLQTTTTFFEYDALGHYLGMNFQNSGQRYWPKNQLTALVEGRWGRATKNLHMDYGNTPVTLPKGYGYRLYRVMVVNNAPDQSTWEDVTTNEAAAIVRDGVVTWVHNDRRYKGLVLYNDTFLCYEFELDYVDKTLSFAVTHTWPAGGLLAPLPFGQVDVIMNGHSLIRNVDYVMHYPEIVVISKRYINVDAPNRFLLRCYGFARNDMTMQPTNDAGWVSFGQISNNDVYNLRDDRNTRCIIGGRVVRKDDLVYSEDLPLPHKLPDGFNGEPYHIDDVMAVANEVNPCESYPLWDLSKDLDVRLSAYLTSVWPQPDLGEPAPIVDRYPVYSPFFQKLMMDVTMGVFVVSSEWVSYEKLDQLLEPYKWWLAYDPCRLNMNMQQVTIHPHIFNTPVAVTVEQYKFLQLITRLYLDDKVQLSGHLTIKEAKY